MYFKKLQKFSLSPFQVSVMGPVMELLITLCIVWLEQDPDDPVAEGPIIAVEILILLCI